MTSEDQNFLKETLEKVFKTSCGLHVEEIWACTGKYVTTEDHRVPPDLLKMFPHATNFGGNYVAVLKFEHELDVPVPKTVTFDMRLLDTERGLKEAEQVEVEYVDQYDRTVRVNMKQLIRDMVNVVGLDDQVVNLPDKFWKDYKYCAGARVAIVFEPKFERNTSFPCLSGDWVRFTPTHVWYGHELPDFAAKNPFLDTEHRARLVGISCDCQHSRKEVVLKVMEAFENYVISRENVAFCEPIVTGLLTSGAMGAQTTELRDTTMTVVRMIGNDNV